MLEFLGGSIDSWIVGYIIVWIGFILVSCIAYNHSSNLKKLQKHGKLISRKGTYTFTPHKENEIK